MQQPEIIAIPNEDFWCLIRVGDIVLLSDEITHHYTIVGKINREDARISFADPWADRSFLMKDRNEAGVEAEVKGGFIVLSKGEFEKVIVGMLTLDDLGLLNHYKKFNPRKANNPHTMLSFAWTALDAGGPWVERSLPLLRRSVEIAMKSKDTQAELRAADRLHFALLLASYLAPNRANSREIETMQSAYGLESLSRFKSAEDFYRLGNAAGQAQDYDAAEAFYGKAIELNGKYEEAFLYRGLVFGKTRRIKKAVADFTEALSLNAEAIARTERARQPYDSFVFLRIEFDQALSVLEHRRVEALQLRAANAGAIGDCVIATADAKELLGLNPKNQVASQIKGMCR